MIGTWSGSPSGLTPVLNTSRRRCLRSRSRRRRFPTWTSPRLYAGCAGQPADGCSLQIHGGSCAPGIAREVRTSSIIGSSAADVDAMLGRIEARSAPALDGSSGGMIFILGRPDRATRRPRDWFPHREPPGSSRRSSSHSRAFRTNSTLTANPPPHPLTSLWRSLRGSASGAALLNYIDPELPGVEAGLLIVPNLDRLVQVKHRYDPHDVFRSPRASRQRSSSAAGRVRRVEQIEVFVIALRFAALACGQNFAS